MITGVGVALLAGLGAVMRYLVDRAIPDGRLPAGTLVVNVTGCLAVGAVDRHSAVAVGLLGGYTTLSAVSVQVVELLGRRKASHAIAYVGLSVALGLLAVEAGRALS